MNFTSVSSQSISLYRQFNGRYDFTFVGNTLNPQENNYLTPDYILTTSSADLSLDSGNVIEKAYLYWAGSGTGDFNVKLNGIDITPERTFATTGTAYNFDYFSAFKDVTDIVLTYGNATYTLSELDLNALVSTYNQNGTNFAGWAIIVVYKNDSLPLNALNIYDGLERISPINNEIASLTINIDNLNVIDDVGSKIGFLAWEGDRSLDFDESLKINNIVVSNTLNPPTNAFNGTNSVTNSDILFNMDLDIYNIQNNIQIGDTSARIDLTSSRDYVMINAIVTKLNSQLPDATVTIDDYSLTCNNREIPIQYTVSNLNSTDSLPAGTMVSIYADNVLVGSHLTPAVLEIGESVVMTQTISIPSGIPNNFTLTIIIDENRAITELIESNNSDSENIHLLVSPPFNNLPVLEACNLSLDTAYFDFSGYEAAVKTNPLHTVTFHESESDAALGINSIPNTNNYFITQSPKTIFVRIKDENCYSVTSFLLNIKNCPPIIYNAVSANGDGLNDTFHIEGLYNIFVNFKLEIYNRWGKWVWTGNNDSPEWDGYINDGIGSKQAPDGTYFYILHLNDPDYPKALNGYLYLNH